jgi:hypothetical protein
VVMLIVVVVVMVMVMMIMITVLFYGCTEIICGPPLLYVLSFKFRLNDGVDAQSIKFRVNSVQRF